MRRVRNVFFGVAVEVAYAALIVLGGYLVVTFFHAFMRS